MVRRELGPAADTHAAWLRQRLGSGEPLVVPGAFDALSARLIGLAGFEACYLGGYAALASAHAMPDLGLAGMSEMSDIYRRIAPMANLPVIVDADTGYGGPLNIRRTVSALTGLGVAAIQIEDQVNPKQCGHVADKAVVSVEEACQRIRVAATQAGTDGPAIIARTDALEQEGLAAAVDRANRYLDAGATAAFVDAPESVHEISQIPRLIDGPTLFNAACTGRGPQLPTPELFELGYAVVFFPIELLFSAHAAIGATLRQLARTGAADVTGFPSFAEVNDVLGLHASLEWDRAQAHNAAPVLLADREPARPSPTERTHIA